MFDYFLWLGLVTCMLLMWGGVISNQIFINNELLREILNELKNGGAKNDD